MKKHYAILIVFILALNPILASATVSDADENPQPTLVNESENEPQPNTIPQEPEPSIDNPVPTHAIDDVDVSDIPTDNPETNPPKSDDEPKVDLPDSEVEKDNKEESEDKETEESSDEKADTDEDNAENEDEEDVEETGEDDENKHVHSFTYTSNKDGTHTITCTEMIEPSEDSEDEAATECTYEEIEACVYDENDICIYCLDKKPEEEEEFAPSISFSISNQSFTIGDSNPVISVNISQDDYDIEYAQACFANYGKNKFINVGLAQGKYFDSLADAFVYTYNDCWCASPDITTDYSTGTYSLRSIYVRSTTGESIHYSIESDSLPDALANISITISPPQSLAKEIYESIFTPEETESAEEDLEPADTIIIDSSKDKPEEKTITKEIMNAKDSSVYELDKPRTNNTNEDIASAEDPAEEIHDENEVSEEKTDDLSSRNDTEISDGKIEAKESTSPTPQLNKDYVDNKYASNSKTNTVIAENNSMDKTSKNTISTKGQNEKENPANNRNDIEQTSKIGDIFKRITNFFANLFRFW